MNSYVKKILKNVDINNQNSINEFISNLEISLNSKRMYAYWIIKYLESLGKDSSGIKRYEQAFVSKKNDLTFAEVQEVKNHLVDLEQKFIFNALLDTGARIQEFVSVDWKNVNSNEISIKTIKNQNSYRNIFLEIETFEYLIQLQKSNFDFSKINVKRIQYLLNKIGKQTNLSISLSPHVLRRTKGSILRMNGAALEDIADLLGHKKLDTTRKYYSKLNIQYLKSINSLSSIAPIDSIDVQKLIAENKLLKRQIVLLTQDLENEKAKNNQRTVKILN